jgi:hypothetical protein
VIIDEQSAKALQDVDTQIVTLEMTTERKERYKRLAEQIIDLLRANATPLESYSILRMVLGSLQQAYGIRGGFEVEQDDAAHG